MNYSTDHTIYLQDGSLFNFRRRFKKHSQTLIQAFSQVIDGRSKFGKRHSLALILVILFSGITAGNTTVKDCHIWSLHNRKWLKKYFELLHGLPDERTLSRAIARVEVNSLIRAFLTWKTLLYGLDCSLAASFDGKTLNGVHGKERIKHILSLFSHTTHQILGQIGVTQKENEIPAFKRLLQEQKPFVDEMLLVGDALHTQKETIKLILENHAHYLLFAKGNQDTLETNLKIFFDDLSFKTATDQATYDQAMYQDVQRGRDVTNTITISHDNLMCEYLSLEHGWEKVLTVGRIHRIGTRTDRNGQQVPVDETVYLISSKELSAKQAAQYTRSHWSIENNLHWQKDYLFLEDRQTLRSGNAPQVMTFLRSMCISLFNLWQFISPAEATSNFGKNTTIHHNFLRMAGVV